jgi:outer membrane protein TolC
VERYKVGLAIQADVLQAENSVLTQRSQLLTARSTYQSLLDQMTTIIGLPQEYKLGIDADGALIDLGGKLPEDLWVLVQANSYDLKSLNVQLANLRLSRDQQLDKLKPQLGLSVSYGRVGSDNNLGAGVTGLEDESYSVALNWAKTPGERATKAQLAQSDIDLASTELSIQDTELQLKTALRTAQRDLETKFEQIGLAENNVRVLEETYNIQLERNSVGLATMLDVIDAEEKLLGAQLALLQARVSYQETYRQIQLLAGVI